jgi:hypothetical protein
MATCLFKGGHDPFKPDPAIERCRARAVESEFLTRVIGLAEM